MITDGKKFDSNAFYVGGNGMFICYHDVVKPVYLYAIYKMLLTNTSFGLPLAIIENMTIFSLIEWYINRRYRNPLMCLDYRKILDSNELDNLLSNYLDQDESIYRLSPGLNIRMMLSVYKKEHMTFPVYIYSEREEPFIAKDCKEIFSGIPIKYVFGDLSKAVAKCDQNFTYILSDIECLKSLCEILLGTYSHILLTREYRYNYKDNCKTFKYDLGGLAKTHPFLRIGTTAAIDSNRLALSFANILQQGGK